MELNAHSPLGASGAARWMACPGSVGLSQGVDDPEDDTYSSVGTGAHNLAAQCLHAGDDTWSYVGTPAPETSLVVDKDMADAVQVYLSYIRGCDRHISKSWIEQRFHCPKLHELFYGTADYAEYNSMGRTLLVLDYKHGAGIVVEAKDNPQCLYYACAILEAQDLWDKVDDVTVGIIQPRGFHSDGPIRTWDITTLLLRKWLDNVLLPAMRRAMVSSETHSGEHCRFCPARRRACPQLLQDMSELEVLMQEVKTGAAELTNEQVGRFLDLFDVAKIIGKAANETAFARLNAGQAIPGRKLANARANRTWKEDAEAALKKQFGRDAYNSELKSPAQIEKMPLGNEAASRWAFKPDVGLTVVKSGDSRIGVNTDVKSMFKDTTKKGKK